MLHNWLKIAFINYKRNWLSTLINIFGMTIGFTGFMLILMHWNDEESYEKWNPEKDRIYFFQSYFHKENSYGSSIPYPFAKRAAETIPEVDDFVAINNTAAAYQLASAYGKAFQQNGYFASDRFFTFFPFRLVSGSYSNALRNAYDIAISSETANTIFGKTDVAGERLRLDNRDFIITAVYELPRENTQIRPDFVINPVEKINIEKDQWGNFSYLCFFMLKKDTPPEVFEHKFQDIITARAKAASGKTGLTPQQFIDTYGPASSLLTPLDKMNLHAKATWFNSPDIKTILILFVLSILIVLLSAINFINLKTAQASQRAKETGIRKAIGSSRFLLALQFLTETFIICLASYILSLVLTELLLPAFNTFFNKKTAAQDWHIYLWSFGMILFITLISGLIPALYLSGFKAIETLKGNFTRSRQGTLLRNGILILQLVISSFFIIGSLIIHEQVSYMMNKDLGFNGKQILQVNFSDYSHKKPWRKYERLKTEMLKIPGVESISYGEAVPGSSSYNFTNMMYLDKSFNAQNGAMDYNYLQFIGVPLVKGRWLNPEMASDTISNVIVNQAFVKKFGWTEEEALHRAFLTGFDIKSQYRIVGIVKDHNIRGLHTEIEPVIFFHYLETPWVRTNVNSIQLKIDADDIEGTVKRIRTYWQSTAEPGYPVQSYFVDKEFAKTFETYQKQQALFTILNAMVLLVALLGLFALSSLIIGQKLKEVAIRKTLGASDGNLIFGLTRQFLLITLAAVLISMPVSYYLMNEWLKDFAYRIDMPAFPFLVSLFSLWVLTFAVVSIKAWKATKVNLVKYLKYE